MEAKSFDPPSLDTARLAADAARWEAEKAGASRSAVKALSEMVNQGDLGNLIAQQSDITFRLDRNTERLKMFNVMSEELFEKMVPSACGLRALPPPAYVLTTLIRRRLSILLLLSPQLIRGLLCRLSTLLHATPQPAPPTPPPTH